MKGAVAGGAMVGGGGGGGVVVVVVVVIAREWNDCDCDCDCDCGQLSRGRRCCGGAEVSGDAVVTRQCGRSSKTGRWSRATRDSFQQRRARPIEQSEGVKRWWMESWEKGG